MNKEEILNKLKYSYDSSHKCEERILHALDKLIQFLVSDIHHINDVSTIYNENKNLK